MACAAGCGAAAVPSATEDRKPAENQGAFEDGRPSGDREPTPPTDSESFRDVTAGSGLNFIHRNGQEAGHLTILETLGGGVALLDFDGDGLLDVFVTGGGEFAGTDSPAIKGLPCRLFKNLGGWKFQDVTADVGLDKLSCYTHGAAVADYDRDGWLALFRNVPAPGSRWGRRFEEVTERAGLTDKLWSVSAAWGDLDGDGWPDLYVCHYVNWSFANDPACLSQPGVRDTCPPGRFESLPHTLYHNNGDGTFTDVSEKAGLYQGKSREYMKGLGVLIADLDDDGRPDIYVANDQTQNLLYLNQGGMRFEEEAMRRGVARDDLGRGNASMGVDAADYDGSGNLSLFVTNFRNELHSLFRNRGNAHFTYASKSAGLAALGSDTVAWGTGFLDFDLDGNEDLVFVSGHVFQHPAPPDEVRQRAFLLRNARGPKDRPHQVRFENVSAAAGAYFRERHSARGLAIGDLDNDGRPDLVISHLNEPVVLLRNISGEGCHWLGVELAGRDHRDLVGAKLTLETGGRRLVRAVKGGGSYCSSSDRRILFGLGQSEPAPADCRLTVRWPGGAVQTLERLVPDRYWRVREGESSPSQP
jgi:enediyne biosynthesis protein E4